MNNYGVTRGAQVTGVAVASLALSWITVTMRFYVRLRIQKFIGRDDWLTIAAMALLTVLCILPLQVVNYGLGAHIDQIPNPQLEENSKLIFVCELLYVATTAAVKAAIGAYFLRLAGKRYQRTIIYVTLAVVMLFSTMYFFFLLVQCRPINYLWTQFSADDDQGSCLSKTVLANVTYAHAAMSAVTDWTFGLLPIAFVWRIRMTPRTKFSVALVLGLGFFSSSATIVRIVYIQSLTETTDYTWEGINLVKWSMVEPAIAITAGNIATLRPLFIRFFPQSQPLLPAKRLNTLTSSSSRPSTSSEGYTAEFAEMLGLARVGVTTTISAGHQEEKGHKLRWRKQPRRLSNESEMELNTGRTDKATALDWAGGIQKTTVITFEGSQEPV